ncbi:nicotinamide riboside kinase 1-like isoform X2 [Narcine bancroftii]|uniref:nicotinamide riboside kinase 1-like isoform X2 n=1 Tax=Narcine bancroftii TaxID=1343680 RepID=UPI00383163C2
MRTKMKQIIVGIGGMTNGGKTTLACSLKKAFPNSFLICQDTFFKEPSDVKVGEDGFQQYDVITALDMETMMDEVCACMKKMAALCKQQEAPGYNGLGILIIEGFLLYNYKPLNDVFNQRYYLSIPYEECKRRRCLRTYDPPDPPGYFDGHVWPMYLRNRKEMEENVANITYLDGTKSPGELFTQVYEDILRKVEELQGSWLTIVANNSSENGFQY